MQQCAERVVDGQWEFLNLDTDACGRLGIVVAINSVVRDSPFHGRQGVLHAVESTSIQPPEGHTPFSWFHQTTRALNPDLNPLAPGVFHTVDGHHYGYLYSGGKYDAQVTSVDGNPIPNWTEAPLAQGPVLDSAGHRHDGYVELCFREGQTRTILDFRDARAPRIETRRGQQCPG